MRVVIQRVRYARLSVGGELISQISQGLMVLVGIAEEDGREEINYLCKKLAALRVFDDDEGVMNRSVMDVGGEVMLVSQFTLMANTKKGNRPSYIHAAHPEISCTRSFAPLWRRCSVKKWRKDALGLICRSNWSMMGP